MHKDIMKKIEIPENVEIEINDKIKIKGEKGEIERKFKLPKIEINLKDKNLILESKNATKKEKRKMNTIATHIKNMIIGVTKGFIYKLKIVSLHFPMNVRYDKNKRIVIIKNFLGETKERIAKVLENVDVEIKKDEIIVSSIDKEKAGQTAANIETATKIRKKDQRVFQDGIWIINKAGREL